MKSKSVSITLRKTWWKNVLSQKLKSIETNLLESYEEITDLIDHSHPVDLLLLDFAWAFDKVPHSRLHSDIYAIGINQAVVDWLMNFLSNRKQKVRLFATDGQPIYFDQTEVWSGVLQGAVLGPNSLFYLQQ